MITKAQHEFTKNKLGQIIPICAVCGGLYQKGVLLEGDGNGVPSQQQAFELALSSFPFSEKLSGLSGSCDQSVT